MNRLAPTKPYGSPLLPTAPHRTPHCFPPHRTVPVRSVSRTVSVTRWGRVWWVSSEHKEPAERRYWCRRRHGREPAETRSRIPAAVLARKQPGTAGLASFPARVPAGRDRQPNSANGAPLKAIPERRCCPRKLFTAYRRHTSSWWTEAAAVLQD